MQAIDRLVPLLKKLILKNLNQDNRQQTQDYSIQTDDRLKLFLKPNNPGHNRRQLLINLIHKIIPIGHNFPHPLNKLIPRFQLLIDYFYLKKYFIAVIQP